MTISRDRLVRITAVCRTQTLQIRSPNSCIASTRILTEVLDYFGHASEPLPCIVIAFNAKGFELAKQQVPYEQWPAEAHSVGVTGTGKIRPDTGGWDGHLVALVEDRWLVDPSLDQLSRPARGIETLPAVLDVTDWTDRSRACHWSRPDGVVLTYQAMPEPGLWREAPDWCGKENLRMFRSAIAAAIRQLKQDAVA